MKTAATSERPADARHSVRATRTAGREMRSRLLDAAIQRRELGERGTDRAVGAVHVEPATVFLRHLGEPGEWVHDTGVHGPGAGHHANRSEPRAPIGRDHLAQRRHIHPVLPVHGHQAQRVGAEAEQLDGAADAGVGFGRRINGGLAGGGPYAAAPS